MEQTTADGTPANLPFELDVLRITVNYQSWLRDTTAPFLGRRILEVGSGIGNMSQHLPLREGLVLSEIDDGLRARLKVRAQELFGDSDRVKVRKIDLMAPDALGSLREENLDTVVSFNVLEHIRDDQLILKNLVELLKSSKADGPKRIVTFVPAHNWAYGELDRSFEHYRRYDHKDFQRMFNSIDPTIQHRFRYMNLIGLLGWYWIGRVRKVKKIGLDMATKFERICPYVRDVDDFVHERLRVPFGQSLLSVATIP